MEPEHVYALISSSIDQNQVSLQVEAEKYGKEAGKKIVFVDGYRNARAVEKIGVTTLPTLVELKKGQIVKTAEAKDLETVKAFVA